MTEMPIDETPGAPPQLEKHQVEDIVDGWVEPLKAPAAVPDTKPARSKFARDWDEIRNPINRTFHFKEVGNYILGRVVNVRQNVGVNKATVYDFEIHAEEKPYFLAVWGKSDLDGKINKLGGRVAGKFLYVELVAITPTGDGDRTWFEFLVKERPRRANEPR